MQMPASVLRVLSVARRCYAARSQSQHHQLCLAGGISGWELLIYLHTAHHSEAAVFTPYRCCKWPDAASNQYTHQPAPRRSGGRVTTDQAGAVAAC